MKNKLLKKIIEYLFTFIFVITLNFFIPRLMPGDPFTFLSSDQGEIAVNFSNEQIEKYKAYYGLDKPLHIQYKNYILNLLKGNIGYSIYYNDSVVNIVINRALWTISIVIVSLFFSCLLGTIFGCLSAFKRNSFADKIIFFLVNAFSQIPSFLIGIILLFLFAAELKLFPLSGGMSSFVEYNSTLDKVIDIIKHAVLPIITLTLSKFGDFYLIARGSMISILSKDYMVTAKAKGLNKMRIIFRHALKNAMLPIVTRIFLSLGSVFGGAILVENVFNYPGIGKLMREAVLARDYVLIQGIFLFVALTVLVMNLCADIVYKRLDPRLE